MRFTETLSINTLLIPADDPRIDALNTLQQRDRDYFLYENASIPYTTILCNVTREMLFVKIKRLEAIWFYLRWLGWVRLQPSCV